MIDAAAPPPVREGCTGPTGSDLRQTADITSGPLQSKDLFKGEKSVGIEHMDSSYRLQITRLGKLILTK
jgi:hemin uptake protein HemP